MLDSRDPIAEGIGTLNWNGLLNCIGDSDIRFAVGPDYAAGAPAGRSLRWVLYDWKSFYFSFRGRIPRSDYWLLLVLPYTGILLAIGALANVPAMEPVLKVVFAVFLLGGDLAVFCDCHQATA